ncbi:MAG TPA: hypothetical protein VGX68_18240 [Thermoanaerobaculia bacterium]|nr:hypothetical protein [Thermoanaerobaculia bacterium]
MNTTTSGDQILSTLRVLGGGGFMVAWSNYDVYGNFLGVLHQEYDSYGAPIGGEFY